MKNRTLIQVAAALFLGISAQLSGQTALKDPMIPDGETATYTVTEGDRQYTYIEEVAIGDGSSRDNYIFTYKTDKETVEIKMEKPTMIPFSTRSVTVGNGISIDSSTFVTLNRRLRSNGILVLSFTDLKYSLRGYPFGEDFEDMDIEFISTGSEGEERSSNVSVTIRYKGIDEIWYLN